MDKKSDDNPEIKKELSPEEKQLVSDDFRKRTDRYLEGKLSEEEKRSFERNVDFFHQWFEDSSTLDEKDVESGVKRVLENVIAKTGLKPASSHKNFPLKVFLHRYGAVAAMITMVISIGISIYFTREISHNSPQMAAWQTGSAVEKKTLPDGSVVYLNIGSKLAYDKKTFNKDNRAVRLEGEAFFEVAKNPRKPFIVQGDGLTTTVKGTSFNVKSYSGSVIHIVSVRDGKVEVETRDKQTAVLTRNLQAAYNVSEGTFQTETAEWENAGGWIDGKLVVFNKAEKEELRQKMEQYYRTELRINNADLNEMEFSASYHIDDNPENIIKDICNVYGMKYKIQDGSIILFR